MRLFFGSIARLTKSYERKDTILAPVGPVAVLAQLIVWLALFVTAFVPMIVTYTHHLGRAITQVGAALLHARVGAQRGRDQRHDHDHRRRHGIRGDRTADRVPAVALRAFNRREVLTTMLTSRAGEPAWGPEILIRHQLVGITDALPDFYASWEQWAVEVSESHVSYPVLLLFRSPDPWSSWVLSLLAVMDAAAMQLALGARSRAVAGAHVPAHGLRRGCAESRAHSAGASTTTRCPTTRSS